MNTYYNNILVPVDNTLNTQKAVAKAIGLASPGRSIIHLTQLIRTWNPFGRLVPAPAYKAGPQDALDGYIKALLHLMGWKDLIDKHGHIAQVKIHIMRGPSMNLLIQEVAQRTPIDLIIITCDKTKSWRFGARPESGDRLARETHCAVLSLNTQKLRGIKEEIEMLSEPVPTPYSKKPRTDTSWSGLTSVHSMLSSN